MGFKGFLTWGSGET